VSATSRVGVSEPELQRRAVSGATGPARRGDARTPAPSVLFAAAREPQQSDVPSYFADLNLDQVVATLTKGREEYELSPYFYTPVGDAETIRYRHAVMRDVERSAIASTVEQFTRRMRSVRALLGMIARLDYQLQREAWLIEAIAEYCEAVDELAVAMRAARPSSSGMQAICEYVEAYCGASGFTTLLNDTREIKALLDEVRYSLTIGESRIKVDRSTSEPDYSAEVEETFARFKQGEVKNYRMRFSNSNNMNHVEAAVLGFVAELNSETFVALKHYCEAHADFVEETILAFDREVQFYLAYRDYLAPLKAAGLKFTYPEVSDSKQVEARETFDLALAHKRCEEETPIVTNDWQLRGKERIFIVSGPNQGGKTTFARTFGQLHHLARIGCPVPGTQARLHLCDQILTHFEKQEDLSDTRGKLEDDLIRVREILDAATGDSLIIMNESFTSTTLQDATFLGKEVIRRMRTLDLLCVYVTFVEQLARQDEAVVSATSMVDPDDPTIRTFKVLRRAADGRAYAAAIAEKYGLSYERLKERLSA
jgi:DNA mismatch repair protein MutS